MMYHTRGEYANHFTIQAVLCNISLTGYQTNLHFPLVGQIGQVRTLLPTRI
jgi:hypothetical protein